MGHRVEMSPSESWQPGAIASTGSTSGVAEPSRWQRSLASAIRSRAELLELLDLPRAQEPDAVSDPEFPLLVPRSYASRMRLRDPNDPLLLQVLSKEEETAALPGFDDDPVGDAQARRVPGLLQKYHGRALLITTGACAVHCRYCFRRHYPYHEEPRGLAQWQPALEAIADDDSITEVILSGGDPLVLPDGQLQLLLDQLGQIPHVQRLRVHTRLPIVLPDRVTPDLLQLLSGSRLTSVMVVHANHAQELAADCAAALRQLVLTGLPVLNQAVLLRGINDSVDALANLSTRCMELGVVPYYLHQLDRVAGAAHFEVDVVRGRELIEQLRLRLPGYLVPRYVAEIAGEGSKRPLA